MRFAHPDVFWLLILVPAVVLLQWRAERVRAARLLRLADAALLGALMPEASRARRLTRHVLTTLGLTLALLALARPQAGTTVELEKTHGVNVVFALDVSRSMLARDVRPDRLRRAQLEIADTMENLKGNRVGLVAFAGVAYAPCPLTTDVSAAKLFLRNLSPDAVPQGGTAVARAVATARALFRAENRAGGSQQGSSTTPASANILVLITDGEDHEGDLEAEGKALRDEGIMLFAVGVGSALGEPIPISTGAGGTQMYLKDDNGQTVLTRLNEATLEKLAADSGGTYVASTEGSLNMHQVRLGIGAAQKAELESRLTVTYDERFMVLLLPGLLCLLGAGALSLRARRPSTRHVSTAAGAAS